MVATEVTACSKCGRSDRHATWCERFSEGKETPKVPIIIQPTSGDKWRAADVLDEVRDVLKKYGYGLMAPKGSVMVLVKLEGPAAMMSGRAIAEVQQISEAQIAYREIDWSKNLEVTRKLQ